MKKMVILLLMSASLIFTSMFYRDEINKQETVGILNYYARVIEKDLLLEGELKEATLFLLEKYQIDYFLEEKSENIKFSLCKTYFSYYENQDIELIKNYTIII